MRPRTVKIALVVTAVLGGATLGWRLLAGGREVAAAGAAERANQERIRRELPAPNGSAPRSAKPSTTPR